MPRDRDDSTSDMEDRDWLNPQAQLSHYVRLRCLELAIRMADPDAPVDTEIIEDVANRLVRYVKTGSTEPKSEPFKLDPDKPF